jgi:hypothetical protein
VSDCTSEVTLRRVSPDSLRSMTEPVDQDRIAERAHLLPEEVAAGSEDPERQAEVILEDSDRRTQEPEQTRHESVQTPGG